LVSKVYFADIRAKKREETIPEKIKRLFDAANMKEIISKNDLVALKLHLGTKGNQRHLRPEHVRAIVEKVREAGGQPFITETTGMGLAGSRGTALGCLQTAAIHGFTEDVVGAPIIVADGPKGLWGVKIEVNGVKMKEIELAQAIAEADALISIAHVKGHPRTGFAGALKNIGMGCVTKCGKAPLHMAKKPTINPEKCNNCGLCLTFCPVAAIQYINGKPQVIQEKCVWGCGCWDICPMKAFPSWNELHHKTNTELQIRLIDATLAVINHIGSNKIGYFNLAYDITPHCDCAEYGDVPMVPDIGVFASKDPVAIDKASADAIINSPGIPRSAAEELNVMNPGDDKFTALTNWPPFETFLGAGGTRGWRIQLETAAKLGLGSMEYELIKIT
jgi:hypothetical protein